MDFNRLVKLRKSSRKFTSKKVSFRFLMEAISTALQGPFSENHNHLKFLIVEEKSKIHKIAEHCEQEWIKTAPALIIVCSDDKHLENQYGERGRVYSRHSAGAAIYSILLELTNLKLGSCWVGAYSDNGIRKTLEIPKEIQIEAVIPVGYSQDKAKKSKKDPLERALFWEKWSQRRRPTFFEERLEEYAPE